LDFGPYVAVSGGGDGSEMHLGWLAESMEKELDKAEIRETERERERGLSVWGDYKCIAFHTSIPIKLKQTVVRSSNE